MNLCKPLTVTRAMKTTAWVVLSFAAFSSFTFGQEATLSPAPHFSIDGTTYLGSSETSQKGVEVEAFLGVPFAAPPTGDLRWRAPVPFEAQSAQIAVKHFQPACAQNNRIVDWYQDLIRDFGGDAESFPVPAFSEDCLYLNIWAPSKSSNTEAHHPVYVYVHGGSNKGGWAYEPNYVGAELAAQGAVVVSVPYRLGPFGFFAHPELDDFNFALLDILAALEWVQANVAQVGGDADRVTLAGESAGADNIAVLLGSPLTKGLFQRAVIQSGGWSIDAMSSRAAARESLSNFSWVFSGSGAKTPIAPLSELRDLSAEVILAHSEPSTSYAPIVGDRVVPESLLNTANRGALLDVDVMLGTNANESLIYLDPEQSVSGWLSDNGYSIEARVGIEQLLTSKGSRAKLDELQTAADFTCPALRIADALEHNGARVFVYWFSQVREGELAQKMGAYHGAELPYIFKTHDDWLPTNEQDRQLTDQIGHYWLEFMRSGSPNPIDEQRRALPRWPDWSRETRRVIDLQKTLTEREHPSRDLCRRLEQKGARS